MSRDDTGSGWIDPDDAPDLTGPEWRDRMDAVPVTRPRGRPRSGARKVPTNLRLSLEVLDAFKSTGTGWQTRIDAALWDAVERLKVGQAGDDVDRRRRALDAMIERRRRADPTDTAA